MEITPLKQLDIVLKSLLELGTNPIVWQEFHIKEKILKDYNITIEEIDIKIILNKLIKDGFVSFEDMKGQKGFVESKKVFDIVERVYSITFDGKVFVQQGGYEKDAYRSQQKDAQFEDMQSFQKVSANNLLYATIALASGTAGLLIWEILKYFFEHCSCH